MKKRYGKQPKTEKEIHITISEVQNNSAFQDETNILNITTNI